MPKMEWADVRPTQVRVAGSKPGDEYVVHMLGIMPQWCTCPSFEHRNGPAGTFCKHMKARHGRKAIGRTRCASCHSFLTPEEIKLATDMEIVEPQICCSECIPS